MSSANKRPPSVSSTDSGYYSSSLRDYRIPTIKGRNEPHYTDRVAVIMAFVVFTIVMIPFLLIVLRIYRIHRSPSEEEKDEKEDKAEDEVECKVEDEEEGPIGLIDATNRLDLTRTDQPLSPLLPSSPSFESSASSEDSGLTHYALQKKQILLDKIIGRVTSLILSRIASHQTHGSGEQVGSAPAETGSSVSNSSRPGKRSCRKDKRTAQNQGHGNDGNDSGDDVEEPPERIEKTDKGKQEEDRKLACPYFKYDPPKYGSWPQCCGPGWDTVHRVKEHLYRRHKQPEFRCKRCWQAFENELLLENHQREDTPCPRREMELIDGFDRRQELLLRKRKKGSSKISEFDKWREVYQVLFPHIPDEAIPDPYYEHGEFQKARREHDDLAEFERFLLRDGVPLLRRSLEQRLQTDFQIVEANLRREAIRLFADIQIRMLRAFRESHQPATSSAGATPSNDLLTRRDHVLTGVDEFPEDQHGQQIALINNELLHEFSDPFTLFGDAELGMDGSGFMEDILGNFSVEPGQSSHDSGYVSNSGKSGQSGRSES